MLAAHTGRGAHANQFRRIRKPVQILGMRVDLMQRSGAVDRRIARAVRAVANDILARMCCIRRHRRKARTSSMR